MKRIALGLLLTSLVAAFGCASMNDTMASWMGSSTGELVADWGPPSHVFRDGRGGVVLVYVYTESYTTPARSHTTTTANPTSIDYRYGPDSWQINSETVYTPAQAFTYTKWRAFWVDSRGIIYARKWRGL